MKIFLGGTRGSFPVSGSSQVRYGGDTFSLLVEGRDGDQVLIDAGSGVRRLQEHIHPGGTVFFTHTHLDHLIGMPILEPLRPRCLISPRGGLREILARVFSPPIWPVCLPETDYPVPVEPVEIGGLRVSWHPVAHPDGCFSYRVDEPAAGASVVVATDTEWPAMSSVAQASFAEFAREADLMIFDAQFQLAEYPDHQGWGHSTWQDAIAAARQCAVRKLWLMHHAPNRTDAELDVMAAAAAAAFKGALFPTIETLTETLHE